MALLYFHCIPPIWCPEKTGTHLQDLRIALKRLIHGISVEVQTKSNKNFISFTVNWLTTVNTSTRTTQVYHVGSLLAAREPQEWKLQNLQFRMAEDWSILMCPCNATSSNTFDSLAYTVNIPDPRRVAKLQRKFRILTKYKIIWDCISLSDANNMNIPNISKYIPYMYVQWHSLHHHKII